MTSIAFGNARPDTISITTRTPLAAGTFFQMFTLVALTGFTFVGGILTAIAAAIGWFAPSVPAVFFILALVFLLMASRVFKKMWRNMLTQAATVSSFAN